MDFESELKSIESRLLSVVKKRDTSMHKALEEINLRLEKHWDRIKGVLERLCELEEKVKALESMKLDELDDREVKSREERALIFDQFLQDQEKLIPQTGESDDSDELDARLNLIATRLAEIERIVRTQIR
jgi:hypothetical protein